MGEVQFEGLVAMSSYYDIDSILTDAQKVPCTFELTVPGLGYIDGNLGQDMKQGTKVELPLWLGEMLAVSNNITLDNPSCLSPRVLNALKADPKTVDLRALAPHFYGLGARMLELYPYPDLIDTLSDTLKTRAAVIADQAHNPRGAIGEGADFLRGLDETERQLFRAAHDSAKGVRMWIAVQKKK
ncbi:GINS complex, Psf3 component [Patellaria atrata CBS 101060]|uniref:DNA replication complex GINS protein PSF3 n=1 Tax=Patellaria atrata CBS 101060 TaxID=1346257 RepID=A0A9P4VVL1_9PEZI|nr:GINS complex, Psf3 component [Patellaria atrata CBS 101060]